ncbi:acyltransferase [Micromonospora sp. CPCC 206060]|uniref:acyltransferase family protein n=1 Tax=Micromonospora sp. CPCC 206060 TaxID=3122406 RepID=UPI002FF3114D
MRRAGRLRQLADRTPATRERYVDLLRVVAIAMVVLGHWTVTVIGYDAAGRPTGRSALPDLPWAYPLTWLVQVMPVFFLVGGFANAASLTAHRRRGGAPTDWLLDRAARLLRPTTALLLTLTAAAAVAWIRDIGADQIRTVVWFATIPLWFLSAYLAVVALAPVMYPLHRRFGLAVPLVLVALVAAGDLARFAGAGGLAAGSYLFGWLAVHQVGFAWHDGRLRPGPRTGLPLLAGGSTALLLLTVVGPYPVVMLAVPGARLDNASPPSLALLAVATAQLGLILALRDPAERWLHRRRPWLVVIAVNAVVLTIFLWHLSATVLLVGVLDALHLLPTPPVGTAAWFAWRLPWLLLLSLVLAGPVAVFGPVEARAARRRPPGDTPGSLHGTPGAPGDTANRPGDTARGPHPGPVRAALTVVAFAAALAGLLINSMTPKAAPEPLGVPVAALAVYLAGAAVLRLLRSGRPGSRSVAAGPAGAGPVSSGSGNRG